MEDNLFWSLFPVDSARINLLSKPKYFVRCGLFDNVLIQFFLERPVRVHDKALYPFILIPLILLLSIILIDLIFFLCAENWESFLIFFTLQHVLLTLDADFFGLWVIWKANLLFHIHLNGYHILIFASLFRPIPLTIYAFFSQFSLKVSGVKRFKAHRYMIIKLN